MKHECILITGGAGFIGSHLADRLLSDGYRVRVLDNLSPQVHGGRDTAPDYLSRDVEFMKGDVRDPDAVAASLRGAAAVVHLAAAVGVGQSMYQVRDYTSVNNLGTAVLLQEIIRNPVARLVVASSMSVYGEGLYRDAEGRLRPGGGRTRGQLRSGVWEVLDERGRPLEPVPTPETKAPALASVYALSKYDQERMCLMLGQAYGFATVALRFFNVYGTRQALSNPYTGVLAIFASRYLNGRPPLLFEDGEQRRDFVHVRDIAEACVLALTRPAAANEVYNIGSGRAQTVRGIAEELGRVLERPDLPPVITGKCRMGDIRHCFADIARARSGLGFEPAVPFATGLGEMAEWLRGRTSADHIESANTELSKRGLTL